MLSIELKVVHHQDLLDHPHKKGCGWGSVGTLLYRVSSQAQSLLCVECWYKENWHPAWAGCCLGVGDLVWSSSVRSPWCLWCMMVFVWPEVAGGSLHIPRYGICRLPTTGLHLRWGWNITLTCSKVVFANQECWPLHGSLLLGVVRFMSLLMLFESAPGFS